MESVLFSVLVLLGLAYYGWLAPNTLYNALLSNCGLVLYAFFIVAIGHKSIA
jgi:hypothetical protein